MGGIIERHNEKRYEEKKKYGQKEERKKEKMHKRMDYTHENAVW